MTDPTDRICAIVHAELTDQHHPRTIPAIEPDTMLADVDCDPLDRLCISVLVEEEFEIAIPDAAIEGWERVADIVRTVRELVGERADG